MGVTSYRNTLMKKAEHTLSTAIPDQLEELEQLLKDSKFQTSYQEQVREYSVTSIADFESKLEEIAEANQAQQMQMEEALKMLFGGGLPGEQKEEDQPGPSKKPSSTSLDSKIVLGKRKRENKKKEGLTLDNKDSNLSIELKISDSEEKEKEEEAETEAPVIGTNLKNDELAQLLKPVILNLYDTCVELRNWITVLVPKVEDGNNFGVEVQEQCIAQL